jgi:pyrroline-5-carboxylate reductase
MLQKKLAFIGGGNMARGMIAGLLKAGYDAALISVSNPSEDKLQALQQDFKVSVTTNNVEAINCAEIVVLAVKPQVLMTVLTELQQPLQAQQPLVISLAAGIKSASIQQVLGDTVPLVLAMPNTPVALGLGMSSLFSAQTLSPAVKQATHDLFALVGEVVWLHQEQQLDVATALCGGGPAYCFAIMEAFIAAAMSQGIDAEVATTMAQQTFLGAVQLATHSAQDLAQLREQVTSKGGTTAAALACFEQQGMADMIQQALSAAVARAGQLAAGSDDNLI